MIKKTKKMLEIEKKINEPVDKYLRREYLENKKSTVDIGKILGMHHRNVNTWLKKFEIPTRSSSEAYFTKYGMNIEKPSDEQLRKWYIDEKMSSKEIAETVGIHYSSIVNWLKKANITRRSASEAKILSNTKKGTCKRKKKISDVELCRLYIEERNSTNEIGKILSVNGSTVLSWLKDAGIPIRNQYEAKLAQHRKEIERPSDEQLRKWYVEEKMNTYEIGELVGVSYNLINKWLREASIPIRNYYESRGYSFEKPSKERLRKWYLGERKSAREIAKIVGVDSNSVLQWLKDANIKRRTLSDAQFAIYDKEIERPSDEQLRKWYIDERKGTREIGELVGVTYQTVQGWLREAGVPRRYGTVAMIKKEKPSDDQLRKWYIDERKSGQEIAEIVGVTAGVIHKWLRNVGVEIRKDYYDMHGYTFERPSDDQLYRWYHQEKKSTIEISKLIGVNPTSIASWLREANIPLRDQSESKFVAYNKEIEKPTDEQLKGLYIEERKSTHEISEIIGVNPSTINEWLRKAGVPLRSGYYEYNIFPVARSWEKLCREMATTFYRKIQKYPPLPNNTLPDWGIDYNGKNWRVLFDAKLGAWAASIEKDIENYLPHCERLEFWCLRGKRESNNHRVKFVFAEDLINKLTALRREDLIDKVRTIMSGVDPYDKRQTKLFEI